MNTKQVIVIRKDLKMRRGKEIAQGSHASMAFLTRQLGAPLSEVQLAWINSSYKKICLQVNSEEELLAIDKAAKEAGLVSHVVEDNGLTEFNGVLTKTCLAIGPDLEERINPITKHLALY